MKTSGPGKPLWYRIDFVTIVCVLALSCIGILAIASATRGMAEDKLYYVKRQAVWCVLGLVLVFLVSRTDYQVPIDFAPYLYFLNAAALAAVLFLGYSAKGAQRWIQIGPFPFQPSEVAKVVTVATLARGLSATEGKWGSWGLLLKQFVHVAPPTLLILRQPDLGTSLVLVALVFSMSFLAGAPPKRLLAILGGAIGCVALVVYLHLKTGLPIPLKDYQLRRFLVFLDPSREPLGSGYHLIQSKIAIGSGRIFGKRLFEGTQSGLRFLPEQHTDFVFSVIGEEIGFIGCAFLIAVFAILVWRAFSIASMARDEAGFLIAGGVASMFAFQIFVNVGMTMGVVPITGMPLPFVSYGGSSFLANCISIGLLQSIYARRRKISF